MSSQRVVFKIRGAAAKIDCDVGVTGASPRRWRSSQDEAFERAIAAVDEPGGPMLVHSTLDPATLADSLQGGIGLGNDTSWAITRRLVDDAVGIAALKRGVAGCGSPGEVTS